MAVAGMFATAVAVPASAAPAKTKPRLKVLILGDSVGQGLGKEALQNDNSAVNIE